MHSRNILI